MSAASRAAGGIALGLLALGAVGAATVPALAAQETSAREAPRAVEVPRVAREIIGETMSPYCPGLLLANCTSPAADTLRRAIVARVAAGESRESITAELIATYGERVRAAPPASGFGLVAWLLPAVVLVGGGAWVVRWQRRSTAAPPAAEPSVRPGAHDEARAERLRRVEALVRREGDATPG